MFTLEVKSTYNTAFCKKENELITTMHQSIIKEKKIFVQSALLL